MTIAKIGRRWRIGLVGVVVLFATVGTVVAIRASGLGPAASAVLGEAGFDTNYFVSASSITNPAQIAIDSGGHLYVADLSNNRVLGWHSAAGFANNAPADVVIGQVDFIHVYANQGASATLDTLHGPQGVATDADGNLYVADTLNNRVTEYTSPFASFTGTPLAGESANFAITATNLGLGESQSITEPLAVTVDGNNNLFVADFEKSRVLEFLDPLATGVSCTPNADGSGCAGDTTVDFVLGQPNLTNTGCDDGGVVASASNLCSPYGMAVDPGTNNLYVADMANNRVVVFPAPISTGESAALVWGEPDLVSNGGGLGPDLFEFPDGVALDSSHNLYVSDTRNLRVLEYAAGSPYPSTSPSTSWGVGGATDFSHSGQCGSGFSGLTVTPNDFEGIGLALDSAGGLYVADACDSRILVFDNALAPTESGTRVLGQADLAHGLNGNETFNASMLAPNSLVVDSQGHLYVVDSNDSRVLGWNSAASFSDGQPADLVIGQPDFVSFLLNQDSADGNPTAASLSFPMGIAVDFKDNLYVADQFNSRVLEYDTPFAGFDGMPVAGQSASRLWGQGIDFTGTNCNQSGIGASSLCNPAAVAFDSGHNMYIADSGNNRVLEYPYGSGFASTTAAEVFGVDSSGTNFTTAGGCGSPSSVAMCNPEGLALDSKDNLYVSDNRNNRVLTFNTPLNGASGEPGAGDVTADEVIGQPDFVTGTAGGGAGGLKSPQQIATDAGDNLFAADSGNNRVLEYLHNAASGFPDTSADFVWGQADFMGEQCNGGLAFPGSSTLCSPTGVAVDLFGNVYIADISNDRVLRYGSAGPTPTPTATATATVTATPTATATATGTATATPTATATATATSTATPTTTATATATATRTATATATATSTATATPTATATSTATSTATPTATATATATATRTATATATATPTATATATATSTATATATATNTATPTATSTATATATPTATATATATSTASATATATNTATPTATSTATATATPTATATATATSTATATATATKTATPTATATSTATATPTATATATATRTATATATSTATTTATATATSTATPTATPTPGALSVSAASLSFGNQSVGTTSAPQTVTVTNLGLASVKFKGISASAGFVETDHCSPSVAASSTCTISVASSPTHAGPGSGTLTLTDDATNSPQVVDLSEKGNNGKGH